MSKVLFVAPHPDDETLGCGGTIFKHKASGDEIHWLIMTTMEGAGTYTREQIEKRDAEIRSVQEFYGFDSVSRLGYPTTKLDTVPLGDLIADTGKVLEAIKPEVVYLPYRADAHSDHRVTFDAMMSNLKFFRNRTISRVLVYETLSETDFQSDITVEKFYANTYVNISAYLEKKIQAMNLYAGEMGSFPFPRSAKSIEVLANKRGIESGYTEAESFMLIKQRVE